MSFKHDNNGGGATTIIKLPAYKKKSHVCDSILLWLRMAPCCGDQSHGSKDRHTPTVCMRSGALEMELKLMNNGPGKYPAWEEMKLDRSRRLRLLMRYEWCCHSQ